MRNDLELTYVDVREPDVLSSVRVEEDVVVQVGLVSGQQMGHLKISHPEDPQS